MAEARSSFLHKLVPNFLKERGSYPTVEVRPMTPQEEFNDLMNIYKVDLPWLKANGRTVYLPNNREFKNFEEDASTIDQKKEQLFGIYSREIRPAENYEKALENFKKEQPELEKVLSRLNDLQKRWGRKPFSKVSYLLTWYGAGATYIANDDPNKSFVRLRTDTEGKFYYRRPSHVAAHETVHLAVEWLVQQYGIDQDSKERMVDDICRIYFKDELDGYVRRIINPKPDEPCWIDSYVSTKEAIENLPDALVQRGKNII